MDASGGSSTARFLSRFRDSLSRARGRSSTPPPAAFPTQMSSYKLLGQIGAGVNGIVHMAICIPLAIIVAIKSIDLNCNPAYLRGAKFMSLISHPNILTAHCLFTVDTHLWVVMPFMSGGSLQSIIVSSFPSGLPEDVLEVILKETLQGINYLHSQGIRHGDINAENIFINSDGSVKLTDFGDSSRYVSRSSDFPYWMAPEIIESNSNYGMKADIWSLGVTALELAYGRPPLLHLWTQKPRMMSRLPLEDKNFSRQFKDFVNSCLVVDPLNRWTANDLLLKHSFLMNCNSPPDYLVSLLDGLPSVEERFKELNKTKTTNALFYNDEVLAFVPVSPTEGEPIDHEQKLKDEIEKNEMLYLDNAILKADNEKLIMAMAAQLERLNAEHLEENLRR